MIKTQPKSTVIPENKRLEKPVRIDIKLLDEAVQDNHRIIAKEGSCAEVEVMIHGGNNRENSQRIEVIVENGAQVYLTTVSDISNGEIHVNLNCKQAGYSRVNWVDARFGTGKTEVNFTADLTEPGANIQRKSVYANQQGMIRLDEKIVHSASHTVSSLDSQGVLTNSGNAIHEALIHITKQAVGAKAQETMRAIVLSKDAKVRPTPMLEVENDDVQVGHAASVSALDPDQLFYLQSRGYAEAEAKNQLVQAAYTPILKTVKNEEMAGWIAERIAAITQ